MWLHPELALDHLEDALVRFGHPVVLGEHDRFEVAGESDLLGEPAAVGQQAQPVAGTQCVEAGQRVGEECGVAVAVVEVRRAELFGERGVRRRVASFHVAPALQGARKPWTRSTARDHSIPSSSTPTTARSGLLEVLPVQRVAERTRSGRTDLVHDGVQCFADDALEVPQGLVPVEEDGLDHLGIR